MEFLPPFRLKSASPSSGLARSNLLTGLNWQKRLPLTIDSPRKRFLCNSRNPVVRPSNRSENSEPSECLLNRRGLFCRAWILFGSGPRCYETKLLFAVQKPRTLGHETVLTRDPFLDLLVGGALTGWLLIAEMAWWALTSSIVIAGAHSALRPDWIRLSVPIRAQGFPLWAQQRVKDKHGRKLGDLPIEPRARYTENGLSRLISNPSNPSLSGGSELGGLACSPSNLPAVGAAAPSSGSELRRSG